MKIMKTKKAIFAALSLIIITTEISVLQSCSNNDENISLNRNENVKSIPFSSIPEGVKPIVVKSDEEMNKIIKQLEEMTIEDIQSKTKEQTKKLDYTKLYAKSVIKNLQNNKVRFKVDPYESDVNDYWTYDIIVTVTYPYLNCPKVLIESRITNFVIGYFTWNPTKSSGSWEYDSYMKWWLFHYTVEGDVSCYFVEYATGSQAFLWRKAKTVSGTIICK